MPALVECVPNFSEGRDKARVDAILEAMKMDGVYLLDREMDADHNRCVITLVGDPVNVAEAAIRGVGKAAELIDLTKHTGAHPRLGAADVIPFIPIEGVTLEDCVAIARRVGEEIWKRYQVPVYLYEAAAQTPERQNLENIRRGQFEGIREEVKTNPARKPDFGNAALHPTAGATVVGARKFLVAYNVYLNTPDVEIAKKVAKSIRFSNGGLRYVKGMGVPVRGLAQVSMNLTDTDQTPIARVFEYVKREAARYGVMPLSSEIVGLIPKKALEDAAEWFLQIENFRFLADSGEPAGCRDERQDGRGWNPRRRGTLHRAASRADSRSRRRLRLRRHCGHGRGTGRHGSRHVARQEGLPAIRARVERRSGASRRITRAAQGCHRRRCRILQRSDGGF